MIDLMGKLHDIELPSPVGMWPIAPGWYLLAIMAIGVGIIISMMAKRWWRRQCIKNQALQKCDELEMRFTHSQDNVCGELSVLLRRLTIAFHPYENVTLLEEQWIDFLNNSGGKLFLTEECFPEDLAELLRSSPYQRHAPERTLQLIDACRDWIKRQG